MDFSGNKIIFVKLKELKIEYSLFNGIELMFHNAVISDLESKFVYIENTFSYNEFFIWYLYIQYEFIWIGIK